MKYEVLADIQYVNGSSRFEYFRFDTKGKGKKVLRAHIKKEIEYLIEHGAYIDEIRIVSIKRYDELNFNNVWNKDDYKKFMLKMHERSYEINKP